MNEIEVEKKVQIKNKAGTEMHEGSRIKDLEEQLKEKDD